MIDPDHFLRYVIRPTLQELHLWAPKDESLILGTAIVESGLKSLVQIGGGPALGFWQMEPATHDDLWINYLPRKPRIRDKLELMMTREQRQRQLITNLAYACAMCRIRYLPWPAPIPGTLEGQADYWVRAYNRGGAGTVEKYIDAWNAAH